MAIVSRAGAPRLQVQFQHVLYRAAAKQIQEPASPVKALEAYRYIPRSYAPRAARSSPSTRAVKGARDAGG
jgi:hypothetical protein